MEIIYFHSSTFPYDKAIYPGVGPAFAAPFGWRTATLDQLADLQPDVAIIDHRMEKSDVMLVAEYLDRPIFKRKPLVFRISDPDMPLSRRDVVRFIFDQRDKVGVHYASTYTPSGPMLQFVRSLTKSRVIHLPYAYDVRRELNQGATQRKRRLFLSGASSRDVYPQRHALRRRRRWDPVTRALIYELPHPGYPDFGPVRHTVTHDRFVALAATFTHFFLCGSVYEIELMKFVECAYAGCVPFGIPPLSLRQTLGWIFPPYTGALLDLWTDLHQPIEDLEKRAAAYRRGIKSLRDPVLLRQLFEDQVRELFG